MNRPLALTTHATTPAELVPEALAVIERLSELLVRETRLLNEPKPVLDAALTADKTRLAMRYEALMQALLLHKQDTLRGATGYDRLGPSVVRMQAIATENARAIERQIKATKHVMEIIARAARKAAQPTFTYGKGRLGHGVRSDRQTAVAVNRVS